MLIAISKVQVAKVVPVQANECQDRIGLAIVQAIKYVLTFLIALAHPIAVSLLGLRFRCRKARL